MAKTKEKKGTTTRKLIIGEAIHLFARTGFSGAGFKELAERCGISEAAIFYHFENKEALVAATLQAIVEHNHETVSASLAISDTADEGLLKHLTGNLTWGLRHPEEAQILILIYYFGCFSAEFAETYSGLLVNARKRILTYILAGIREKIFKPKLPPEEVAIALHDMLVGNFVNHLSTRLHAVQKRSLKTTLQEQQAKWKSVIEIMTRA